MSYYRGHDGDRLTYAQSFWQWQALFSASVGFNADFQTSNLRGEMARAFWKLRLW
jgi:hypothetical protein